MLTLLRGLPFSADGDAEGKGMLKDDVRSDCGGLVVVLQLLVASDLSSWFSILRSCCVAFMLFVVFAWYHLRR